MIFLILLLLILVYLKISFLKYFFVLFYMIYFNFIFKNLGNKLIILGDILFILVFLSLFNIIIKYK